MRDHYTTLGVPRDVGAEELKRAYRAIVRSSHPDVAGKEGAARTAEVTQAYSVLSDPGRRSDYDLTLADNHSPVGATSEGDDAAADEAPVDVDDLDSQWASTPPGDTGRHSTHTMAPDPTTGEVIVGERYPRKNWGRLALIGLGVYLLLGVYYFLIRPVGPLTGGDVAGLYAAPVACGAALAAIFVFSRFPMSNLLVPRIVAAVLALGLELTDVSAWSRLIGASAAAFAIVTTLFLPLRQQAQLDRTVPLRSLRLNNLFGTPPQVSPEVMRFDQDIIQHLPDVPGLRVLRSDSPAHLYTHLLIVGRKCICLGIDNGQQWPVAPALVTSGGPLVIDHFLVDQTRNTIRDGVGPLLAVLERATELLETEDKVVDQTAVRDAWVALTVAQPDTVGFTRTRY